MKKHIIWVGLDVHARTIAVASLKGTQMTPRVSEIANEPKAIARLFARWLPRAKCWPYTRRVRVGTWCAGNFSGSTFRARWLRRR